MITEKELMISNKSYINKDFATIYPELLDYVKAITNKWNPQTSNESDPGIVLLKLMGFMGDKLNYNVDKNVLDPSHQSGWNYLTHSWGNGIVDDTWYTKLNYICFRDLTLAYSLPEKAAHAIKAQALNLQANVHNLGYILNSMPNKENPESVRGTRAAEFRIRNMQGVTTYYTFTINVRF